MRRFFESAFNALSGQPERQAYKAEKQRVRPALEELEGRTLMDAGIALVGRQLFITGTARQLGQHYQSRCMAASRRRMSTRFRVHRRGPET